MVLLNFIKIKFERADKKTVLIDPFNGCDDIVVADRTEYILKYKIVDIYESCMSENNTSEDRE